MFTSRPNCDETVVTSASETFLISIHDAKQILKDQRTPSREVIIALRRCHGSFEAIASIQSDLSALKELEIQLWTLQTTAKGTLLAHCNSHNRRTQPVAWRKSRKLYTDFVDSAQSCYSHVLRAVERDHGPLPELRCQMKTHWSGELVEVEAHDVTVTCGSAQTSSSCDAVRKLVCILLIRLGDLARWRITASTCLNTYRTRFRRAIALYELAILVWPHAGHAHNQLGIVAIQGDDTFEAVYQFCRALCVAESAENARQNLEHQLGLIRTRNVSQEASGGSHNGVKETFMTPLASKDIRGFEEGLTTLAAEMQPGAESFDSQYDDNVVLRMVVIGVAAHDLDLIRCTQVTHDNTEEGNASQALLLIFDLLSNIAQLCTPCQSTHQGANFLPSLHIGLIWLSGYLIDVVADSEAAPELSTLLNSASITLLGLALEQCLNEVLQSYDVQSLVALDTLLPEERDLLGFAPLKYMPVTEKRLKAIEARLGVGGAQQVQAEHCSRVRAVIKLGVRIVRTQVLPLSFTGGRFVFHDGDDEQHGISMDKASPQN